MPVEQVAEDRARSSPAARAAFAAHLARRRLPATWAAGWSRARCSSSVLTGSVGTQGGTSPNAWNKFVPHGPAHADRRTTQWNELLLAAASTRWRSNEMSILLPHLLKDGRGRLRVVYFTRVLQPDLDQPRRVLVDARC